jgi:hypothetical protein
MRGYDFECGLGGNRLGCKLRFDDGSILFILDSQITPEIEQFISSLCPPAADQSATKRRHFQTGESPETQD